MDLISTAFTLLSCFFGHTQQSVLYVSVGTKTALGAAVVLLRHELNAL